ncbi:MAG: protein kinase, partial [Myxococcales bacterium]|nr:protein kinase [Myxococcales bacterium]
DDELDRRVAIKVLLSRPEDGSLGRARLVREAQALAKLSHPNVVQVYEVGAVDQQVYLVMEYIEGLTLRQWLSDRRPPWREILRMYIETGQGLAAAHRAGLIHRDFKPANVIVGEDGRPRVLDFGLARAGGIPESSAALSRSSLHLSSSSRSLADDLTEAGTLLGTPAYMAPEQLFLTDTDARCDLYAFCVALWEALLGQRPYSARNVGELRKQVQAGPPTIPTSPVPSVILRLLHRGLAFERDDRWPSMEALLGALEGALVRRRRTFVAALALVVLNLSEIIADPRWQGVALLSLTLSIVVGLALGWRRLRRGEPGAAIERLYAAVVLTTLCSPLVTSEGAVMTALGAALFLLFTAPRVLSMVRTDRWVLAAIVMALAAITIDTFDPPWRLAAGVDGNGSFTALLLFAIVSVSVIAAREFERFPLRSKLKIAFLVVALSPVMVIDACANRHDGVRETALAQAELRADAHQLARALDDAIDRAYARASAVAREAPARAAKPDLSRLLDAELEEPRRLITGGAVISDGGAILAHVGAEVDAPGGVTEVRALIDASRRGDVLRARGDPDGPRVRSLELLLPTLARGRDALLIVQLDARALGFWLDRIKAGPGLVVALADPRGRPLALTRQPDLAGLVDIVDDARDLEVVDDPTSLEVTTPPPWLVEEVGLIDGRYTLITARDTAALRARLDAAHRSTRLLLLLVAAVTTLAALSLGQVLAAPIARLTRIIQRFMDGDINARAPVRTRDELGALAERFNIMAGQVGSLLESLRQQAATLRQEVGVRTRKEEELRLLNEELKTAHAMAMAASRAKDTFLAQMSHELRTPLNAIIGYSELIAELADEAGVDEIGADIDRILAASHHLLALINDILDLSRIEAGKLEIDPSRFDAAALVREIGEAASPLMLKNRNKLAVELDEASFPALTDAQRLRQILLNLLGNAAKFTADGHVVLSLRRAVVDDAPWLIIAVRDDGIGIPTDKLDKLFASFEQVDASRSRIYEGAGLGLAITRRLCQLLGGRVEVESELGVGSTFTVRIPARCPGAAYEADEEPHATRIAV